MQVEVKVPQLSESVSEATLVAWHKKAGEAVKRDENLIDVETDRERVGPDLASEGGQPVALPGAAEHVQHIGLEGP